MTSAVMLQPPTPAQRSLLEQLLQFYLHDFSEFAPRHTPYGEVDANGRFPYPPGLDAYWTDPACVPLLIQADGAIAGFVLLNRWSALDRPLDHAVAEFFVLRKHRRAGIGTLAAHSAFRRHPGRWEIPVADYNPAAPPLLAPCRPDAAGCRRAPRQRPPLVRHGADVHRLAVP